MKFSEILKQLANNQGLEINLGSDPMITEVAAVQEAKVGTISYIEGGKYADSLNHTAASALILPLDKSLQETATAKGIAWVGTPYPKWLFAQVLNLFYQPFTPSPAIDPTAVVDPSAELGEAVFIGPHVVIGPGVKIGDRVCIHANVVIYPQVQIGPSTILHANCTIHERTQIGSNCVIHSGAVIGSEGFGFVETPQGWYKMQQSGITVLEDGVEIGCNTAVDRPAVGETRIGSNTKLDNLVHIGHGCRIGSNSIMAGQVGLAGGVTIGNGVILAGQVGIANQAKIGDRAIASAKAGIHNDVKAGEVVSGIPAMPHKIFLKITGVYSRLPEIYQMYREWQRQKQH